MEYERLASALDALPQLDMTPEVWREAERLGFRLRRSGVSVPVTDVLIAASALEHECVLLHRDRHFALIARHAPLKERQIPASA